LDRREVSFIQLGIEAHDCELVQPAEQVTWYVVWLDDFFVAMPIT